jgi:hypothetical protein
MQTWPGMDVPRPLGMRLEDVLDALQARYSFICRAVTTNLDSWRRAGTPWCAINVCGAVLRGPAKDPLTTQRVVVDGIVARVELD